MIDYESTGMKVRPTAKILLFSGEGIVTVTGKSGLMNLPGGGIDPTDSNVESALLRELSEELGLESEHIAGLEWSGTVSGQTRSQADQPVMSEWQVFSADLIVSVAELVPDRDEIKSYGRFNRADLVAYPKISELARRAIVNFT